MHVIRLASRDLEFGQDNKVNGKKRIMNFQGHGLLCNFYPGFECFVLILDKDIR